MSNGIPEALSFDTIIAGGACPVSTKLIFASPSQVPSLTLASPALFVTL
jgi:hypothetical protein